MNVNLMKKEEEVKKKKEYVCVFCEEKLKDNSIAYLMCFTSSLNAVCLSCDRFRKKVQMVMFLESSFKRMPPIEKKKEVQRFGKLLYWYFVQSPINSVTFFARKKEIKYFGFAFENGKLTLQGFISYWKYRLRLYPWQKKR